MTLGHSSSTGGNRSKLDFRVRVTVPKICACLPYCAGNPKTPVVGGLPAPLTRAGSLACPSRSSWGSSASGWYSRSSALLSLFGIFRNSAEGGKACKGRANSTGCIHSSPGQGGLPEFLAKCTRCQNQQPQKADMLTSKGFSFHTQTCTHAVFYTLCISDTRRHYKHFAETDP